MKNLSQKHKSDIDGVPVSGGQSSSSTVASSSSNGSSSSAVSSSSTNSSSVTLSCTGLQESVEKGGTIAQPTLTCSNGSQATNINWTGRPGGNGSWTQNASSTTTAYTIGANATCGSVSGLTTICGTVTVVGVTIPTSSSSSDGSNAGTSSSSEEDSTPIINHSPLANSHSPTYYSLKGEPLGNAKPQKAGIYIVKQGNSIRKIAVR